MKSAKLVIVVAAIGALLAFAGIASTQDTGDKKPSRTGKAASKSKKEKPVGNSSRINNNKGSSSPTPTPSPSPSP